jgi:hypothetical protein
VLPIFGAAATWVVSLVDFETLPRTLAYMKANPERVSIALIALAVVSPAIKAFFVLVSRFFRWLFRLGGKKDVIAEQPSEAEMLVQAIGVSGFSRHATKAEKRKDWKACAEKIKEHKAKDLRIMGATGWETFGDPGSPLHKLLGRFNGEVKILLMKPDAALPALIHRAAEIGQSPADYAKEIERSIDRLRNLRKSGRNISLKLYTQTPVWKMIISNDYMWLQHYRCDSNVDDTPVYVFFSDGDEGTSLFHALYSVWLKRWDVDGNETVDLSL